MTVDGFVSGQDWAGIQAQLDEEGHAVLAGALDEALIAALARGAPCDGLHRRFYARLAPIANRWNEAMGVQSQFPPRLNGEAGAPRLTRLIRLHEGEEQALHQHGGSFPLQLVALLSEPGRDFTGGEFIMIEQRPRMQSRPMVLPLGRGSVAVVTVAQRPHAGSQGPYRVKLKHAVSRVRSGERLGLELLFDGHA